MASVKKRPDGKWRARYRDPDNKEHAQHFATKRAAEEWLDTIRGDLVTRQYVDPDAGKITFKSYAERWRASQVHRPTTVAQLDSNLRRHVYPFIGDDAIGSIRRSELQSWVKSRSEVLAPSTVILLWRWDSSIFRAATEDGVIRTSPCRGVKVPKRPREQVVPLETETVRRLIEAMPDRYRAAVVLAASTGMRQGEVLGLTVDRVELLAEGRPYRPAAGHVARTRPRVGCA